MAEEPLSDEAVLEAYKACSDDWLKQSVRKGHELDVATYKERKRVQKLRKAAVIAERGAARVAYRNRLFNDD